MTIYSLLIQSWDEILWFVNDIHNKGISWGAVITAILLWRKINRNKRYHERDIRMEAKIDAIMQKVGVECANLTVTDTSAESSRMSSILHSVVLSVVRIAKGFINYLIGRKTIMEKLKSRKLWMALLAAILPVINTEFGLGLDTNSILAVIGVIATYILGQSHVDAKKVQNGGTVNEPTKPTNTIGDTK
jgi:uncharacterized membrane protein (DUF441 family)